MLPAKAAGSGVVGAQNVPSALTEGAGDVQRVRVRPLLSLYQRGQLTTSLKWLKLRSLSRAMQVAGSSAAASQAERRMAFSARASKPPVASRWGRGGRQGTILAILSAQRRMEPLQGKLCEC